MWVNTKKVTFVKVVGDEMKEEAKTAKCLQQDFPQFPGKKKAIA